MSVSVQPRTTSQTATLQGSLLKQKLSSGWWTHPMLWSQKSTVQSMSSWQTTSVWTHTPMAGSQVSVVHAFMSSQSTGLQANTVVVVVVVVGVLVVEEVVVVVVVVVFVVEVVVVTTTATGSSPQSSTRVCNASELFVGGWQSFGSFASSFAKQPLVNSVPPLYLVFALSTHAL